MPRYILTPAGDTKAAWDETPVGSAFPILSKGVEQPAVPDTSTYISTSTANAITQVTVVGPTLADNEQVVAAKAWIYGKVASNNTKLDLIASGAGKATGNQTDTSNAWFSVTFTGALTQAQVSSLSIALTATGAVLHTVYAAYIELFTRVVTTNHDFYFGVNPGGAPYFATSRQRAAGVQFDNYRIAMDIDDMTNRYEATSTFMNYYQSIGIKPLVGVVFDDAMATEAQCEAVGTWLDTYADQVLGIEFGNENSGSWHPNTYLKADEYALRCVDIANAINKRCLLIIQGDIGSIQPGGKNWRDTILATVPNIEDYIDGWSIHRYQADYELFIDGLINYTTKPVWITEMGFANDDGATFASNYAGWPTNPTGAQSATNLQTFYDTVRAKPDVGAIFIFGGEDSASHLASTDFQLYFGVQSVVVGPNTLSDKPSYTDKVKSLITTERAIKAAKSAATKRLSLLGV